MPDFPNFDDLFRIARDEVLTRNAQVSRDAVERDGADANILVASGSAAADEVMGQLAEVAAGVYLDSAPGADQNSTALDRVVFDRYGIVRKPAAASLGSVQFRTIAPAPPLLSIPANLQLQTPDGVQFITTESVPFPTGTTGPVTVAVRSVLAGANQNAKANTLINILGVVPNSPSDLTVSNPLATSGGDDAETDDSLRDRARRYFTTVRRGTIGAIEEAALGVPGVQKATAFEVIDALGRPARLVQLVISDAFTEQFVDLSAIPPRYMAQSQLLAQTVFNALADVRPAGIFVQVYVASTVLQAIQLSLTFQAGIDVSSAALQARAAAVGYVNALFPGEPIVLIDLQNALAVVPGLAAASIVSPLGNVVAKPLQVLRTSLGLVTAIAAQTNQPLMTGQNPDSFTAV